MKRSKAYQKAAELVEADKFYTPIEAASLAKQASPTKFDGTVEVALSGPAPGDLYDRRISYYAAS